MRLISTLERTRFDEFLKRNAKAEHDDFGVGVRKIMPSSDNTFENV